MVAASTPASFGSDEDVWFGGEDRDAEALAEQSVAALGARIVGAKPFPIAARRLEELTRNPKARLEQVVSVLETDPGLSVRLLRLVNSAGYGLKVRVTSVRHAAVLVGTRRLHQVATTAAILDLFATSNETAVELLEHATVVGSLCRYLAVHLGLPHDELFTCGFLHDIGKLMLLDTEGEKYAELVRNYGGGPDQLHAHEKQMFGFDHAQLGAHVLTAWNIPEPVPKVVLFHHQPARAMQDATLAAMVHVLRMADLMSYSVALDDLAGIALVAESEAGRYLEISEPQVAAMWSDIRALADRSRARSNGQEDLEIAAPRRLDVPRSLRPRRSVVPRSQRPTDLPSVSIPLFEKADREPGHAPISPRSSVNEVPAHFPCVACNKPCYGNSCLACRGQVCPEHQVGPDHWCVICLREYDKFKIKKQIPVYLKVTGLALAVFSVGASITGAMVSQTYAVWKLIVAPLTMVLLWGVLLPVAHRLWQRRRFLRTRPKGRVPVPIKLPRPNEVFISSLDASLESEGIIGPSIPPPSQSRISLRGISLACVASELPLPPSAGPHRRGSLVPEAAKTPITDRSPGAAAPAAVIEDAASNGERGVDEALARPSEVMAKAVAPQAMVASLAVASTESSMPSLAPATPLVASRRLPTEGLSEFPSVGTESELEDVVASVSARLGRDLPSNDYMGPSAELRAASIAPRSAPPQDSAISLELPQTARASLPVAPLTASPAPVPVGSEAAARAPAHVTSLPAPSVPVPRGFAADVALATPAVLLEPAPDPATGSEHEPARELEAAPTAVEPRSAAEPAFALEPEPDAATDAQLGPFVFPLVNLDQGCTPRTVFRCAIPVAESCSPAPRRTSLRPRSEAFAASIGPGPSTLRGLG